jgi:type I restriction enzyme M protein
VQLKAKIQEQAKTAREAQAKAEAIDATIFDLKAVNPNSIVKIDTRTPEEVIQSLTDQGTIVARTLGELQALLQG